MRVKTPAKSNRRRVKTVVRHCPPSKDPELWTSIRVDREVRRELAKYANGFDSINQTLRRLVGLDKPMKQPKK